MEHEVLDLVLFEFEITQFAALEVGYVGLGAGYWDWVTAVLCSLDGYEVGLVLGVLEYELVPILIL